MTEKHSQTVEECLAYFGARPVYRKLFLKLRDKYASLGHAGGTVTLSGLKPDEKAQLGGFFQKDYSENKSVTISAAFMEKTLAGSRFSAVTLEELLTAYFKEALTVNKEERQQEEERRRLFFEQILRNAGEGTGKRWLEQMLANRGEGYHILMQQYRENAKKLQETLWTVMQSIAELPALKDTAMAAEAEVRMPAEDGIMGQETPVIRRELLAVFAARTTGNPHYYDEGTIGDKFLTAFLKEYAGEPCNADRELTRAERKNRLLYEAGILKDDLSNDTLVYGIHALRSDGRMHEGIEGFCRMKEPVRITLLTVGNLKKAWPQSRDETVYVVENPAVFSVLSQRCPDGAFICGNGQPRLATLVLMDLLRECSTFYYAGDFDPEGLLIAQRLKRRYGEKLILWNYEARWYETYQSSVELDETRLKKLGRIELPELQSIKEKMYQKKKAAYQEAMMEELASHGPH